MGSTRVRTTASGAVYDSFDYLPFGEVLSGINDYVPKFTGDAFDNETNLDHTLFRQYAGSVGRWNSPDPLAGDISNPQSLNRYAYVLNNPLGYVDPLGADAAGICEDYKGCIFDAAAGGYTNQDLCAFDSGCNPSSGGGGGLSISVDFGGFSGGNGPLSETNGLPSGVSIPSFAWLAPGGAQCDFGPCSSNSFFNVGSLFSPAWLSTLVTGLCKTGFTLLGGSAGLAFLGPELIPAGTAVGSLGGPEGAPIGGAGGAGASIVIGGAAGYAAGSAVCGGGVSAPLLTKGGKQNIVPSWADGERPRPGESAAQFAKRLCDARYGPGNYDKGPGSEYSKIKKWARDKFGI